jgi:hypothetical protein
MEESKKELGFVEVLQIAWGLFKSNFTTLSWLFLIPRELQSSRYVLWQAKSLSADEIKLNLLSFKK